MFASPNPQAIIRRTTAKKLGRILAKHGERKTLRLLGISRHLLYRALAGLPVRRGSELLLERALADVTEGEGAR